MKAVNKLSNIDVIANHNETDSIPKTKKHSSDALDELVAVYVKTRNEIVFHKIIGKIYENVLSFIKSYVKDEDCAKDVMSVVMEKLYIGIDSFDSEIGSFITWTYRIAKNEAIDYIRSMSSKRYTIVSFDSLNDSSISGSNQSVYDDSPVENYGNSCNVPFVTNGYDDLEKDDIVLCAYDYVVKCIDDLPKGISETMRQRFIMEKSYANISEDNCYNMSTVKTWIRRGKDALREKIIYERPDICRDMSEIGITI